MDEEQILMGIPGWEPDWQGLSEKCQIHYGCPLVAETPSHYTCVKAPSMPNMVPPRRALFLEEAANHWFLLEHPGAIDQYDRFGQGKALPALTRPTLFTRLWREGKVHSAPGSLRTEGGTVMAVLSGHLETIIGSDSPSDWHLDPNRERYQSRKRVHGLLVEMETFSRAKGIWLIQSLLAAAGLRRNPDSPQEGRLELKINGSPRILRISVIPSLHGPALVVRFLYPEEPRQTLEALGAAPAIVQRLKNAYREKDGLWLLAGPTGSGKSTTLHALLRISVQADEKVLAVEDPAEVTVEGVHHLSIGSPPELTFALAARSFLRQSPDCLLIGEIRDVETASIAIQAARTGHRVLSSLHARDDTGLLRRMEDLEQEPETVISVARMILHQRLIPLICPECSSATDLPALLSRALAEEGLDPPRKYASAPGCGRCREGTTGRRAILAEGNPSHPSPFPGPLAREAWALFRRQEISVKSILPFLTPALRGHFQICQP